MRGTPSTAGDVKERLGPDEPILSVKGLTINARQRGRVVSIVEDVSLSIPEGQTLGIVGESGSGKTMTAMSIGGLLPGGVSVAQGAIRFDGQDLAVADDKLMRSVRGSKMGFIFQDPQNSLDPAFTVGDQLMEAIRAHQGMSGKEAKQLGAQLLDRVGIAQAGKRLGDYPHQFSGGMAQRVMIAIALCCNPKLLIADEPTTALDVTMQAQILQLISSLKDEFGLSVLLISHDLGVIAQMADQVAVMYAGHIVEQGPTSALFATPLHPYMSALIAARPEEDMGGRRLTTISGTVPSLAHLPTGCRFHTRCTFAQDQCKQGELHLVTPHPESDRLVRCVRSRELALHGIGSLGVGVRRPPVPAQAPSQLDTLLEVRNLTKVFGGKRGLSIRQGHVVRAVEDFSFEIRSGETLGLVGETGAGKSTVGRLVLGLDRPTSGSIVFRGSTLGDVRKRPMPVHRDIQVIFQNPYASLNPSMTVTDLVAEPLDVHKRLSRSERQETVAGLLNSVGLSTEYLRRYIYELSGGQLQRIAIARVLSVNPKLIVLDEPISALDVSTQSQVINLLEDLQESHGLSYLFIGHNLAVVSHISDRLAVMYHGRCVEIGSSQVIYRRPRHPYSQALVGSVLSVAPAQAAVDANGHPVVAPISPAHSDGDEVQGCPYAARCPLAEDLCVQKAPPPVTFEDGTTVYCHFVEEAGRRWDRHQAGAPDRVTS